MVKKYFLEFFKIIQDTHHKEEKNQKVDWQTLAVCTLGALSLLFVQSIAKSGNFVGLLGELGLHSAANSFRQFVAPGSKGNLTQLMWFASMCLFFYMLLPTFLMRVFFKKRFVDFGVKFKGAFLYGKFYIVFMVVMVPLIMLAATFPSFQRMYPFYQAAPGESVWPYILVWEVFYFFQFVGTEFFFRGFLIHGLKHRFGFYVIFVSMIPYCMIHFQKPFLEAFGSIIAGLILGVMSLRTNSILMGVALHFGVALMMDICSLILTSRW